MDARNDSFKVATSRKTLLKNELFSSTKQGEVMRKLSFGHWISHLHDPLCFNLSAHYDD